MKEHLLQYGPNALETWLKQHGQPRFRAGQVLEWVYGGKERPAVRDFSAMTNLPGALRELLARQFELRTAALREKLVSRDGTVKFLLAWPDGALTETVLMPDVARNSVCVSSQVGCPVGCAFCASGQEGLQRSLTAGEIVEQVLWATDVLNESGPEPGRISNVVVMGMGEPLLNYEAVLAALRTLNATWGLNIGARHMAVSTIGLPSGIRRLAQEEIQLTLAVSLHAADDELRRRLIPWARNVPLEKLFDALAEYYAKTHREVTLEYLLLAGVNDSAQDGRNLARWAKRVRCNVNLINYNAVAQAGYRPVSANKAKAFLEQLRDLGINAHLRRSRGAEIEAACGQLRRREL